MKVPFEGPKGLFIKQGLVGMSPLTCENNETNWRGPKYLARGGPPHFLAMLKLNKFHTVNEKIQKL